VAGGTAPSGTDGAARHLAVALGPVARTRPRGRQRHRTRTGGARRKTTHHLGYKKPRPSRTTARGTAGTARRQTAADRNAPRTAPAGRGTRPARPGRIPPAALRGRPSGRPRPGTDQPSGTTWPAIFSPPHLTGHDLTPAIRTLLPDADDALLLAARSSRPPPAGAPPAASRPTAPGEHRRPGHFFGALRAAFTPRVTHRRRSVSVAQPAGETVIQPRIEPPRICAGAAPGSAWTVS
jgi:hypothetical protein